MFLKKILARVSEVSLGDAKSPEYEVQDGETVVGVLPDDLKRLYVVYMGTKEKARVVYARLSKEVNEAGDDITEEKKKSVTHKYVPVRLEEDLVGREFWTSVRFEFPQVGDEDIGLRAGWQVVTIDPMVEKKKTEEMAMKAFMELFQRIFGK